MVCSNLSTYRVETIGREIGGFMLTVSGLMNFYYLLKINWNEPRRDESLHSVPFQTIGRN